MKFYVTGCIRTGTTLVKNLMYAFKDMKIEDREQPIEYWEADNFDDSCHHVAKRHYGAIFSNTLSRVNIDKQIDAIINQDLFIINCLRQQKGVMKSTTQMTNNLTVSSEQWRNCMKQAKDYCDLIGFNVSYEALCSDPDTMQDQLIEVLREDWYVDLVATSDWSRYPKFVPQCAFDAINLEAFPHYGPRPIERHVGKYEKEIHSVKTK